MEGRGSDGRIGLRWILRKWAVMMGSGCNWLRIVSSGGL
jgi:hypothetical protein